MKREEEKKRSIKLLILILLIMPVIFIKDFACTCTEEKNYNPPQINYFMHYIADYHRIVSSVPSTETLSLTTVEPGFTYSWRIVSKPSGSNAQLSSTSDPQPTINIDLAGYYYIELIVTSNGAEIAHEYAYIGTLDVVHHVRSAAGGTGSGDDWTNAYTSLPAELQRGHTYYIADGTYTSYDFNTAEENDIPVYIMKAIDADHGYNADWNATFDDNQAVFNGYILVTSSYLIVDGQAGGGPASWTSGHGIKIQGITKDDKLFDLRGPNWYQDPLPHDIRLSHVELQHRGNNIGGYPSLDDGVYSNYYSPKRLSPRNNIYISYCCFHDFNRLALNTVKANYWLFEYNYVSRNTWDADQHGEGWQDFGSHQMVIRYNYFEDVEGTAFIAFKKNYAHYNNNWEIYGNIFSYTGDYADFIIGGNGAIGASDETTVPCDNIFIYNNTFFKVRGFNVGIYLPYSTNVEIYNNMWCQCDANTIGLLDKHDYNWFFEIKHFDLGTDLTQEFVDTEKNSQLGTGVPFTDSDPHNRDLHLSSETESGMILEFPYNYDMYGTKRGSSGSAWDRGAIEE